MAPRFLRWQRRRPLSATLALALALTMVAAASGSAVAGSGTGVASDASGAAVAAPGGPVTTHQARLLTGDQVMVEVFAGGQRQVSLDPAGRERAPTSYQHYAVDGAVYVIPSDVAPLVGDVLDPELFNVTKLDESGYTDATPVIIQREPAVRTLNAPADDGLTGSVEVPSIGAVAATVDGDGRWWRSVTDPAAASARTLAQAAPLAGVQRVWLDEQVEVLLDESADQVGAPQAWQQGFDGTGATVAVLDTGIDEDHPDLAGTVVAAQNFTDSDSATDRHGHGTHVAGTIAGSGAAADGAYTGVAPGAQLLNGKVLGDGGSGQTSWVLAGMEWAAANADVVNMSLGAGPTDGTDPVSLALNSLTDQHGTLFVVAAGNSGPAERSVATPGSADAALTVGAVDKNEQLANFSSRGPRFGDWAIKPDVTAPGVGIAAARADGTALGPVVDEHYTRISGTSMATPHAAGAAAILRQQDPDLTPAQVKAALVTTAVPHGGLTVYQQGGGRIDVPAALETQVLADPAPLDLGYFSYPHDETEPVDAEVTYTNRGEQAVTLDLSLAVSPAAGPPVASDVLSVEPSTLVVGPGETAVATVSLDAPALDFGLYGGYLTAGTDGQVVTRIPVGFHMEDERYDLTITGIDRNGDLAPPGSSVGVLNVENMLEFMRPGVGLVNGRAVVRVPPGTYSVLGAIHTDDEHGEFPQATAFVGDPELTVTEDVELVLDSREANRIEVETPEHDAEPQGGVSFGYWRSAATPGPIFGPTWLVRHADRDYYAAPMSQVTLGDFEFHSRWRLAESEAELEVVSPETHTLDPVLLRAPAVDGEQERRLVDVGLGRADDYDGVDVTGAVALVTRGPVFYEEQEQHAAAAGAAALIVTNDVPGRFTGNLGEAGSIPTLSLTRAEGDLLRDLLADSEVTVRLDGTVWSPYVYDLMLLEKGGISPEPRYVVTMDQLAVLETSYYNDAPGHRMGEGRSISRPFHSGSILLHPPIEGPQTRTEYVIGGDDLVYQHTVYGEQPFEARLRDPDWTTYEAGETVHKEWFGQVVRPALMPEVEPTTRTGDQLRLRLFEWVDSGGHLFPNQVFGLAPYPGDTIETRLYRDGELVGELDGFPRATLPMVPEQARYRVELDVDRDADWWTRSTSTRTVWSFDSQRPDAGTEVLPLLSVDYTVDLDLSNTAPHPRDRRGPATLELDVRQQDAGAPAVAGAQVWISYDEGDTWREREPEPAGDGRFEVNLPARAPAGAEALSLRVRAWDADGNEIEQTVIRAWHLP